MSSRIQATLPDPIFKQLQRLQSELQLDASDVVEEAIGLFSKAVLEARRGARVAFLRKDEPLREYSSPALARLEWDAQDEAREVLANRDFDEMSKTLANPPAPNAKLRKLMRSRGSMRKP